MGCHTWFYRRATPKEVAAIKRELIADCEKDIIYEEAVLAENYEIIKDEFDWMLKHNWLQHNEFDIVFENQIEAIHYYLLNEYRDYIHNVTADFKEMPETIDGYDDIDVGTSDDVMALITRWGFTSYEEYRACVEQKTTYTYEEMHQARLDDLRKKLASFDMSNINVWTARDTLAVNCSMPYMKFGLVDIVNDALYVESGFGLNEKTTDYGYTIYEPNKTSLQMHDVFRIYDYTLCLTFLHTYEDCVKFANDYYKTYHDNLSADANEEAKNLYPKELSADALTRLKKWFNKYPDSYVTFG